MRRTTYRNLFVATIIGLFWGAEHKMSGQSSTGSSENILPGTLLSIESIRLDGTNIVINVDVSADIKSIVLESSLRIGGGNWEPRAVQRLSDFTSPVKVITFRVPRSEQMELIRARGETGDVLPPTFFQGTNSYGIAVNGLGSTAAGPPMTAVNDKVAAPATPTAGATTSGEAARSVVESDIWKIDGDTLYFFNQYRGLQVVDISQPDTPVVRGTYELPAAGEQMYLLGPNRVVLLARDNCRGWGATSESALVLLDVVGGQPTAVAEVTIPGYIRESRLVGTALYVVSERYQPFSLPAKPGDLRQPQMWEWGSQVSSFDLSQFSKPVAKSKEWVSSGVNQNVNAIIATDRLLFVAAPAPGQNSWNGNSEIHVFDISAPDGTMQALSSIQATGKVKDKFKMNLKGDVFTAVTETAGSVLKTQVETYSLADPKSPKQLAVLPIIEREAVYATRFADNLLYVVTFLRIDPLWIIDLSDPARPKKVSELTIPGWSTFIQPLEGRLVTVGIDNTAGWRTAVQLFDVQNPAKPALLSKVILGEQYSSSEANYDEKAFGVLPEYNLILVPYSTSGALSSFQGVHLIDLEPNSLRKRGAIESELQARRATVHRDRILSVSGVELLSVDAADRDHPKIVTKTELSWSADRLFLQGSHLVEISSPWGSPVSLRVVLADSPSKVLKRVTLANLPFLGATARDQKLYVVQGNSTEVIWPKLWNPTNYFPIGTNQARLQLSVFDLAKLPEITMVGQTSGEFDTRYWSSLVGLWPKPGVLVWSSSTYGGPWRVLSAGPAVAEGAPTTGVAAPVDSRIAFAPWWGGNSEARFLAYDVTDTAKPAFLSEVKINGTNYWWNFSKAFATDGLIYVSHQASEYLAYVRPPPGTYGTKPTVEPPPGVWAQRYFLDVINYGNPKEPSVRKPLNLPGALIGVSRKGQLLYTQGYRYGDLVKWTDYTEWLDAVAYDGVEAHGVDSLPLPQTWPHPVLASDAFLYLGRSTNIQATAGTTQTGSTLEVWTVADSGKFARVGSAALSAAAMTLQSFGDLLAVQVSGGDGDVKLFDASKPSDLKLRASSGPGGCIGYSLDFAAGALNRGLWIPRGQYGVIKIPIPQ